MPRKVTVTFSDGTTHVYDGVPDDATPDQVMSRIGTDFAGKTVKGLDGGKTASVDYGEQETEGLTGSVTDEDSSAGRGFVLGALKPLDNLTKAAMNIPGMAAIDRAGQAIGLPSASEAYEGNQKARERNTSTLGQFAGNVAGTLPTAIIPGGALVQGGATGALLSDAESPEGAATDAAGGALFGKLGQMATRGLGYVAKPVVGKASQALYDAGVPQTLGQIASQGKNVVAKGIAGLEEGLTSIPGLGHLIDSARDRGLEGFNIALGNRVLANIGQKLPKTMEAGDDMVSFVGRKLNDAYTALVPKLVATGDKQFAADIAAAKAATNTLPDAMQDQFGRIMMDVFKNRVQGAHIKGQALKDAESRLTKMVNNYSTSTDADQRILGEAIDQARQALRGMVSRSNPKHAAELEKLNRGWAEMKQLRTASTAAGNASGVVTPAQALSAARKRGYEDQLSKDAKMVLPNRTPNSGTVNRAATAGLLGSLATGGVAGATLGPAAAIPGAGSLLYTEAGQKLLNELVFGARPKVVQKAGEALQRLSDFAPAPVAAIAKDGR